MIAISAGHHNFSKGASYGSFNEHDEAVLWADYLVECLEGEAILVPHGFLKKKVAFINGNPEIKLAIEIHFNSALKDGEHIGKGSETLHYPGSTKGVMTAHIIQATLGQIFTPDRGVKEGYYQMKKHRGPDFFLAKTRCTALILEPEFIQREAIIKRDRKIACEAIAGALLDAVSLL